MTTHIPGCLALALAFAVGVLVPQLASSCDSSCAALEDDVDDLKKLVEQLTRQVMLQQLYVEERIRSDGGSGLKQTRQVTQGTLPVHATTATVDRIAAMHEHSNNIRVVGMGELVAVLNGLEFRTRHNDYKVNKPLTIQNFEKPGDKIEYDAVEDIEFPEVPPEVLEKESLDEQIEELRLWFKAWRDQNHSKRDYRKYFKAILCYLEGAWTVSSENGTLDESFESDRHFIDADSWLDLQEKVRYTSYGGRKDSAENYAYLPTTIMSMTNGTPSLAQWNYRILCHPLGRDLSTKRLKLIDDITSRLAFGRSMETHAKSRAARYRLAPRDRDGFPEKIIKFDFLDELMSEIPGKDGYGNELVDNGLDDKPAMNLKTPGVLSAGYYHRWFKASKDAMGSQQQHRGFSDENMFMAKTTQEKVAPIVIEKCKGKGKKKKCSTYSQRWSYAIPMEIIYLTPLNSWNPYGIEYKGFFKDPGADSVIADGRNGQTKETALNGTNNKWYYITPAEFFANIEDGSDKADTAAKSLWVLDKNKEAKEVVAAGTRIFLPNIPGIGKLRTRFPIMPLHYEGSAAWKELTALKHTLLERNTYKHMYYKGQGSGGGPEPTMVSLTLTTSESDLVEPHDHLLYVDRNDLTDLYLNKTQVLKQQLTEESNGHTHTLSIKTNWAGDLIYGWCDDQHRCWDKHPFPLQINDE